MGLVNAFQPTGITLIDNTANYNGHDGIDLQGVACNKPSNTTFCAPSNITVSNNTTNYNGHDGIDVGEGTASSTISHNTANHNVVAGIGVGVGTLNNSLDSNRGSHNGLDDGFDANTTPPCGTDAWQANTFISVNQACVAAQ
jgi:parallel beta-helix repeat protein